MYDYFIVTSNDANSELQECHEPLSNFYLYSSSAKIARRGAGRLDFAVGKGAPPVSLTHYETYQLTIAAHQLANQN